MSIAQPILPKRLGPARRLRWPGEPDRILKPLNAGDLLDSVTGLSEAQAVAAPEAEIERSAIVAGIEIARSTVSDETKLRRLWKQRNGGGPTPLLLLADDPDERGSLRVLGPVRADEQVYLVTADALDRLIRAVAPLSRLQATRRLGRELRNLDQTDVAGLRVQGLGTTHLFTHRLRGKPVWSELAASAEAVTKPGWDDVLRGLGYQLERLPDAGYLATHKMRPVCVIHPKAAAADFSRLDDRGRPPEGMLLNACLTRGAPYGMLAAGPAMRLFVAAPAQGSAVARYLELDASAMQGDDRALLGLLSPAMLAKGKFDELLRDARDFGSELKDRVDRALRQDVLPVLGRELGKWAAAEGQDLGDDAVRKHIEDAALTFVFRALFLLYAESSDHLPMNFPAYEDHSLTRIVEHAHTESAVLDPAATSLWSRISTLVQAMRTGNTAWRVPGYNGELFSASGFAGADLLERATITDAALGPALVALGRDDDGIGVDFSSLEIGHLGHIYEGLLSLRLSLADRHYRYDARRDRYLESANTDEAADTDGEPAVDVEAGELLWITNEGGRKSGGVYYTPELLVRHLVRRGVLPAFEKHLDDVRELLAADPAKAAHKLLDFKVLDPACGSAHFLVVVVDELADATARFLAETPVAPLREQLDRLQQSAQPVSGSLVEDAALLRRLILKHCVFGVDISPMGAEIAKLSLWLSSFVPGLSLLYLGHNIRVGNSLIGVSRPEMVRQVSKNGNAEGNGVIALFDDELLVAMREAASAGVRLADLEDRTPAEYELSVEAAAAAEAAVRQAQRYFNLWCAEPLGLEGARKQFFEKRDAILAGDETEVVKQASEFADDFSFLHWPLAFPDVFTRDNAGFDAVIGNPPWEEIKIEELGFFGLYSPRVRSKPDKERRVVLNALKQERPGLVKIFAEALDRAKLERRFLGPDGGYANTAGDADTYKYFCQRYRDLLRPGGQLAVVLPRNAFIAQGSRNFRDWLMTSAKIHRIDFLLNSRRWIFDIHAQFTVALVLAEKTEPVAGFTVAGVATSEDEFRAQSVSPGQHVERATLGLGSEVPLIRNPSEADLLSKLRTHSQPFALGAGGRWNCFPVSELHETNDRALWSGKSVGAPLWKGESFEQFMPRGTEERRCDSRLTFLKAHKKRPGSDSLCATKHDLPSRQRAVSAQLGSPRVAFRLISNRTNSRTILGCLIPGEVFLTNAAPYLTFPLGGNLERACCLGIMNSLSFDWQARRFIEINVNNFLIELLHLPDVSDVQFAAITRAAARLSCVDARFTDFADSVGVECGPITTAERTKLRIEIDAHVAQAWAITQDELEVIFSDFTETAVTPEYRQALRDRLRELTP